MHCILLWKEEYILLGLRRNFTVDYFFIEVIQTPKVWAFEFMGRVQNWKHGLQSFQVSGIYHLCRNHINPLMNFNKFLLKISHKIYALKPVTFSWIWIYLHILHRVRMSVLLVFVEICTANSFNKICVHMLCRKNQEEYFKRVMSRKSVWQYFITIIFLFNFVLYCWCCTSSTKYLFLEWSMTNEKNEPNWMASKMKSYVKPELTQYFLLSLYWDSELLPLDGFHNIPFPSQSFFKSTDFTVTEKSDF